jgi:hypothetical protein
LGWSPGHGRMLSSLLGAAGDSDEGVRRSICEALVKQGEAQPEVALPVCQKALRDGLSTCIAHVPCVP